MEVAWSVLLGSIIVYGSGVIAETCLVYNHGSFQSRDCDSCCDAGVRRRCCSDMMVVNKSSTSVVGIAFGCFLGALFLAGVCGTMAKCFHMRRRGSTRRTGALSPEQPPFNSHLDPTDPRDTHQKPPAYSEWVPPPPYTLYEGSESVRSGSSHVNQPRSEDENVLPPPYTTGCSQSNDELPMI